MRITADTNVLVRAAVPVADPTSPDGRQAAQARAVLRDAEVIAVSLASLCEFVWVLRSAYRFGQEDIALAVRRLLSASSVACDRTAVEAGLRMLEAGGDFADGIIAFEGAMQGGQTFVTFDRKAARLLRKGGQPTRLLEDRDA